MSPSGFLTFVLLLCGAVFFGSIWLFCSYLGLGWWGLIPAIIVTGLPTALLERVPL